MPRPPRTSRPSGGLPSAPPRPAAEVADLALRELMAVREIAHAFLTADRPEEVFRFALERVAPLVGASFASVYVVDDASELMTLAAAFNWPAKYAPWISEMRVRVGFGPSGEAAAERRAIEIPDVFADNSLEDWQEVAKELGFRAIVAIPLQTAARVLGAVTFYFTESGGFPPDQRSLLRIVADQMAATAEKAQLITDLRRANAALTESNTELEKQYLEVLEARRVKDEFLAVVSHELRTPLTAVQGYIDLLQDEISGPLTTHQKQDLMQARTASDRLLALIDALLELTTLKKGLMQLELSDFDPRSPLHEAIAATPRKVPGVTLRIEEPQTLLPTMRSDHEKIVRVLISLLANAFKFTEAGEIIVSVMVRNGRVAYVVRDSGIGIAPELQGKIFDEFRQVDGSYTRRYGGTGLGLSLARRLARLLGGEIELESAPGEGSTFTFDLPLEHESPAH